MKTRGDCTGRVVTRSVGRDSRGLTDVQEGNAECASAPIRSSYAAFATPPSACAQRATTEPAAPALSAVGVREYLRRARVDLGWRVRRRRRGQRV